MDQMIYYSRFKHNYFYNYRMQIHHWNLNHTNYFIVLELYSQNNLIWL